MMHKKFILLGWYLLNASMLRAQLALAPFDQPPLSHQHVLFLNEIAKGFFVGTPKKDPTDAWKYWNTVPNLSFGKDRGNLIMINDVNALHPYFRDQVTELIKQCKAKGINLAIVETYRTHAKQNEYRSMGKKYTRNSGGRSKHQYGLAVDVVPIIDSVAQWDNHVLWKKVGSVGEKLGLRWGGRWRSPYDPGHFEWTGGLSSHHLFMGQLPVVKKEEQYPCLEDDLKQLSFYWKCWEDLQTVQQSARTNSTSSN